MSAGGAIRHSAEIALTPRQEREIEYHRSFAQKKAKVADRPVCLDVVQNPVRRWWNAYWHTYTLLKRHDLRGKTVLVPGCGFGEDAIRIASLGARVFAFDISPEIVDITRRRVRNMGLDNIRVERHACEQMGYEDDSFDFIFFLDILHHVDIPATVAEINRVTRPGGTILGNELYTHSFLQKKIRESWLVDKVLYQRMVPYIYGSKQPYITEDERKIDEKELALITGACDKVDLYYFHTLITRILPERGGLLNKADQLLTRAAGSLGRFQAARVVFEGRIAN